MAADYGGGRRQRTTMAREIGRRTTTGKVGSGRQTTTALSIRDGEDNVVFDNAMMTQHGLNYGLADIGAKRL
jgi:hypothetical protein